MIPKFPSIKAVAKELQGINRMADEECDVRLQVWEDGDWIVRSGDSQYDPDHRGYWGSSSVPGNGRRFRSMDIARDLIEQAREHEAQEKSAQRL